MSQSQVVSHWHKKACLPLLNKLCDQGYEVSLETSGALDISQVDSRVIKVRI